MINISLIASGQPARNVSVPTNFSLTSLLAQEGFSNSESVTLNGVPTSDLNQSLNADDSIFVTRSNKGGRK